MKKIQEAAVISLFFFVTTLTIGYVLNPIILSNIPDLGTCLIDLVLNFIIVKLVYDYVLLKSFRPITIISASIINAVVIFILLFYTSIDDLGNIYTFEELLINIIMNEPIVTLLLFNLIYCIYRWLLSKNYGIELSLILCELLIIAAFTLSIALGYQLIEKNNMARNNIRYFISAVDDALYSLDTNTADNIENEMRMLENSFMQLICNSYTLSYNEQQLFDKLEDYSSANHTASDRQKIKAFLKDFEKDFKLFLKENHFITNKEINEFMNRQTNKFKILVQDRISH